MFNYVINTCDKTEVEEYISSEVDVESINGCVSEIVEAIKYLPHNKSPGHDSLMPEHFQYASDRLPVLLAVLFKLVMQHGYLPDSFMLAMLVPILKSKTGVITSTRNYRPIALATVRSKIMETFPYKSGHSTDMCIYLLKEAIRFYTKLRSPVCACFLDASNAFDKLIHWIPFKKLKQHSCPVYLVKFIVYWY